VGLKWTVTLKVEFDMLDGRPDGHALAQTILTHEVGLLKHNIERVREAVATEVKSDSARVRILSQGPAQD
jgi:hypothetical protein